MSKYHARTDCCISSNYGKSQSEGIKKAPKPVNRFYTMLFQTWCYSGQLCLFWRRRASAAQALRLFSTIKSKAMTAELRVRFLFCKQNKKLLAPNSPRHRLNMVSKPPRAWWPCADAVFQKQTFLPACTFFVCKSFQKQSAEHIYSVSEYCGSEPEDACLTELSCRHWGTLTPNWRQR